MLFTPRTSRDSEERREIRVSEEDHAAIILLAARRDGAWKHFVTDIDSGELVLVEGAPCSLSRCLCDAVIVNQSELN